MTAKYLVADVFDGLATLEDGSVDLVVTSPPFLALRSYLPADDPLKSKEIGSEATPAVFLDVMLRFTAELRRVLAPHGSICIELGDTYANDNGNRVSPEAAAFLQRQGGRQGSLAGVSRLGPGWPLAKSKTLIPELYRIALAYGINPLTGQPSPAGQWRIRNVVTWARPNPPVGALGDKWRPATSDVVVACVSPKRYWDDLATRKAGEVASPRHYYGSAEKGPGNQTKSTDGGEHRMIEGNPSGAPLLDYWEIPLDPDEEPTRYGPKEKPVDDKRHERAFNHRLGGPDGRSPGMVTSGHPSGAPLLDYWEIPLDPEEEPRRYGPKPKGPDPIKEAQRARVRGLKDDGYGSRASTDSGNNPAGTPLLDYWVIPPGGYTGSHYAVFPPELVVPLVKAMTPEKVCRECGEPSRRITGETEYVNSKTGKPVTTLHFDGERRQDGENHWNTAGQGDRAATAVTPTLGWTDCGHNDYRPGLVLDPFAGSGTTLLVATGHGHDAVGIDLDSRNAELALQRVGPFLLEVV